MFVQPAQVRKPRQEPQHINAVFPPGVQCDDFCFGRTPRKLFDPKSGALPYTAGDRIKFEPITAAEFAALAAKEGTT